MTPIFLRRWLAGFWLVLAVLAGIIWAMRLDAVRNPDQGPYYVTSGFEDVSLFNISRIRYGNPAYVDCFVYPYRASLFNWLFYRLYGGVAIALDPAEIDLALVLRLVTLAWAVVGAGVMLTLLLRPLPEVGPVVDVRTTVALVLVAWLSPFLGWWTLTARPDIPAVVCELIALVIVLRGSARLSLVRALAAGAFFFLAWSFKQSSVGIFGGTLLALLLRREWANALRIGAVFLVPTATVLLTSDSAYFVNLFEAPALAPLETRQLLVILYGALLFWGPLLLVGAAVFVLALEGEQRRRFIRARPVFLLSVVGGAVLLLNLGAARRPGCSGNYLFETWFVGMMLTGLVQRQASSEPAIFATRSAGLLFYAFTAVLLALSALLLPPLLDPLHKPDTQVVESMVRLPHAPFSQQLQTDVRASARPIFCEDSILVRLALGSASDQVPVVDLTIYGDAQRAGRLSQPDIAERIQQREYVNIWLYAQHSVWEPFVREAGYVVVKEDGIFRQWGRPGQAIQN